MSGDEMEVVLDFQLTQNHVWIATPDEWAAFCRSLKLPDGIDDDSVEEVGEWLASGGWEVKEALHELAVQQNTWVDNGDSWMDDLQVRVADDDESAS